MRVALVHALTCCTQNLTRMSKIQTMLFILALLTLFIPVMGQSDIQFQREMSQLFDERKVVTSSKTYSFDEIEGSPYLTSDYHKSRIIMQGGDTIRNIRLRYNMYHNNFEFIHDQSLYQIKEPHRVRRIEHLGKLFVFHTLREATGKRKKGFLVKLAEGPCSLYKHYRVEFEKPEEAQTPFHQDKPPRFDEEDPDYYLKPEDQQYPEKVVSLRKGKFLNFFGPLEKELKDYINEQDIDLKEEKDLIRFVEYYNSKYAKNK